MGLTYSSAAALRHEHVAVWQACVHVAGAFGAEVIRPVGEVVREPGGLGAADRHHR